jgi:hypothetical protein
MESVVGMTYAPSGLGKTVDMGFSFPRALFLAPGGSTTSIRSVCGFDPVRVQVGSITEATALMVALGKEKKGKKGHDDVGVAVLEDLSWLADREMAILEEGNAARYRRNKFALWKDLRRVVLDYRDASREAGFHVFATAWDTHPRTKDTGEFIRGGPQLSGNLPEKMPGMNDLVLRLIHDPGQVPWPIGYTAKEIASYVLKDRYHVVSRMSRAPANLREILVAGLGEGIELPRHKDLPNQENEVAVLSSYFVGSYTEDRQRIQEVYRSLLGEGKSSFEASWTTRDALHRAVIRRELRRAAQTFGAATALG